MTPKLTKAIEAIRRGNPELFDETRDGAIGTADIIEAMGGNRREYAQRLIDDGHADLARQAAETKGIGYWDSNPERTTFDGILAFASIAAGHALLDA